MASCGTLLTLLLSAPVLLGAPAAKAPAPTVLEYLKSVSGKKTLAGLHNREPNAAPAIQTAQMHDLTGRFPALWSGDFLFKADDVNARWAMIYECKRQWDAGSVVQLMLHVAPPTQGEGCAWEGGVLSHLSDEQWKDLTTEGGALNKV